MLQMSYTLHLHMCTVFVYMHEIGTIIQFHAHSQQAEQLIH